MSARASGLPIGFALLLAGCAVHTVKTESLPQVELCLVRGSDCDRQKRLMERDAGDRIGVYLSTRARAALRLFWRDGEQWQEAELGEYADIDGVLIIPGSVEVKAPRTDLILLLAYQESPVKLDLIDVNILVQRALPADGRLHQLFRMSGFYGVWFSLRVRPKA